MEQGMGVEPYRKLEGAKEESITASGFVEGVDECGTTRLVVAGKIDPDWGDGKVR